MFFDHYTVNHSEGEFVRDGVTTNSVEGVFAVLKRGLIGVYHHASQKHLGRYVVGAAAGKRLTYADLIA